MTRTALSLFVDDTHVQPAGQLAVLLDFCQAEGVRGKVSLIPALDGAATGLAGCGPLAPEETAFLRELGRADGLGLDVHMELMTHGKLWDFARRIQRKDGPCEGIWLYDPDRPVAEYRAYLGAILDNAAGLGITINGVSVPGCDCADCATRWQDLQARGHDWVSANAVRALLDLASEGRMGVASVAVYADEADEHHPTRIVARRGGFSVFDARLDMSVQDQIGFDGQHDADFYISADGKTGRIADLVRGGAEQCFFCAHWFAMNPARPRGWQVFQDIISRINSHLADHIEWVRPSAYGLRLAERMGGKDVSQG